MQNFSFSFFFFLFQSVEGLKRLRLFGALALTKGESGDCWMCVGFLPQLESCDGWKNGKVKRRINLLNEKKKNLCRQQSSRNSRGW